MASLIDDNMFKPGDKIRHIPSGLDGIVEGFSGEKYVQIKVPGEYVYATWDIADCELVKSVEQRAIVKALIGTLLAIGVICAGVWYLYCLVTGSKWAFVLLAAFLGGVAIGYIFNIFYSIFKGK